MSEHGFVVVATYIDDNIKLDVCVVQCEETGRAILRALPPDQDVELTLEPIPSKQERLVADARIKQVIECGSGISSRDFQSWQLVRSADAKKYWIENVLADQNDAGSQKPRIKHSLDFRSVVWGDQEFSFTENQSKVVKLLYENWDAGTPEIGDYTLLSCVDHTEPPKRLSILFREHPAWKTMIIPGKTKGSHRMANPPKN